MMKKILFFVIGLVFCLSPAIASASLTVGLSGSINSGTDGGITGFGGWSGEDASTMATLTWLAESNLGEGTWTYTYTWTAAQKDLSHLNIEISDNFDENTDLISWSVVPNNGESYDIGKFDGNDWKAFKFDDLGDYLSYTCIVTTNRMPMDGNFYAEDGTGTNAYNSVGFKIAVPNSVVPIPSTILLLGSGLAGVVGFRRKKIAK